MYITVWFGATIVASIALVVSGEGGQNLLRSGATTGKTDYCGKQWQCETFKHFMCEFKKNAKTKKCSKIEINISPDERQEILAVVNDFRENLAGGNDGAFPDGAQNIRQITWDYELESFAEVYGSQCGSTKVPELDVCAKAKESQEGARCLWGIVDNGIQDVITGREGWTSVIPEPEVIQSFEPVDGEDRLGQNYGRYTMLAWAATYKVGCSIIRCTCDIQKGPRKLVCFFGPSGNFRGKSVFFAGEACKSCPANTACNANSKWRHLCARKGDPVDHHTLSHAFRPQIVQSNLIAVVLSLVFYK